MVQLAAPDRDRHHTAAAVAAIEGGHENHAAADSHNLRAIEAHRSKQIGQLLNMFAVCGNRISDLD
jgi:hypothetical protein